MQTEKRRGSGVLRLIVWLAVLAFLRKLVKLGCLLMMLLAAGLAVLSWLWTQSPM